MSHYCLFYAFIAKKAIVFYYKRLLATKFQTKYGFCLLNKDGHSGSIIKTALLFKFSKVGQKH